MNKIVSVIVIIVLMLIIFLQRYGCEKTPPPKSDSVRIVHDTIPIPVHDTAPGKIIKLPGRVDTSWRHDTLYTPSSNYDSLLNQYDRLGDQYFSKHSFKTKFTIRTYGFVTVYDTIVSNTLMSSNMITDLSIPEIHDSVFITKQTEKSRQLYIGGGLYTGTAVKLGLIYKDKKDRMYGVDVLYDGNLQYGLSYYWKIKIKD